MRVKLVTFRYSATLGGFDDTPLSDFARDKEVIAFREHFYTVNEVPHVTCVVTYQDAVVPQAALQAAREIPPRAAQAQSSGSAPRFQRRDGAPDPCAGLDESERALFNHLREWRSKQAHDEGLPPYLILTNRQLVAIVRKRPESPTALGHLDGIGPGKIERYGAAILKCLHGAAPAAARAHVASAVEALAAAATPAATDVRPATSTIAATDTPADTDAPDAAHVMPHAEAHPDTEAHLQAQTSRHVKEPTRTASPMPDAFELPSRTLSDAPAALLSAEVSA